MVASHNGSRELSFSFIHLVPGSRTHRLVSAGEEGGLQRESLDFLSRRVGGCLDSDGKQLNWVHILVLPHEEFTSYCISFCYSFFICRMRIIIVPIS